MKRKKVLYLELADKIKADIFSGKYPVGSMLPTEVELEKLFNVSKITVRKAIELLASEEYVQKKSGKGTTVLSNRPYNKLSRAVSFTQILENSNYSVEKITLNVSLVDLKPNDSAFDFFSDKAVCLERLYLLDGTPYIYFKHYISSVFSDIPLNKYEEESLYRIFNQNGYYLSTFKDSFKSIFLTDELKKRLGTSDSLAIMRVRKSFDNKGDIVEYSEAVYNTNKHPYLIEYET